MLLAACPDPPGEPPPGYDDFPDVAKPPNVVLIVLDTTRGDRVTPNGYPRTTPWLQRLADEGTTFADCWTTSCWTSPSHASLFTGLRPENHGLYEGVRPFLDESVVTLAERLRDAGYLTAGFSNNLNIAPETGFDQGFGVFEPLYRRHKPGPRQIAYPWSRETHRMALDWLDGSLASGKPFFLFVNDMEPHLPYEPPRDVAAEFVPEGFSADEIAAARAFEFPRNVAVALGVETPTERELALRSHLYDAEIATLDAELGEFLVGLAERGLAQDTLVVVTSDHGELLGEHGLVDHMFSLHRQLLHVPLVIRFPGRVDAGEVVSEPVRMEDVAPTILELCGLKQNEHCDGASLFGDRTGRISQAIFGRPQRQLGMLKPRFPGADMARIDVGIRSVYDGRLHYIRYSNAREELYDVVADPAEENDLAPAGGALLELMRRRLGDD